MKTIDCVKNLTKYSCVKQQEICGEYIQDKISKKFPDLELRGEDNSFSYKIFQKCKKEWTWFANHSDKKLAKIVSPSFNKKVNIMTEIYDESLREIIEKSVDEINDLSKIEMQVLYSWI